MNRLRIIQEMLGWLWPWQFFLYWITLLCNQRIKSGLGFHTQLEPEISFMQVLQLQFSLKVLINSCTGTCSTDTREEEETNSNIQYMALDQLNSWILIHNPNFSLKKKKKKKKDTNLVVWKMNFNKTTNKVRIFSNCLLQSKCHKAVTDHGHNMEQSMYKNST